MVHTTMELLTTTEAGQILRKSARTVQRMADAGDLVVAQKLPGPNGAYLFRRSDVEALLEPDPEQASA
jgi:excisionase family DNA binding protein